jgi:hypothetical protein
VIAFMTRRARLAVAVGLGLIFAGAGVGSRLRSRPSAASSGPELAARVSPRPGETVGLAFEIWARSELPTAANATLFLSGTLYLKPFRAAPDGWWNVAARIADVAYQVDGSVSPDAARLELPFVFRVSPLGYVEDFRTAPELPPGLADLQRQVIAHLQVGLPARPRRVWHSREVDGTGAFRARYTWLAADAGRRQARLQKEKLAYLSLNGAGIGPSSDRVTVHAARSILVLPLPAGWPPLELEATETISSARSTQPGDRQRVQVTARRTAAASAPEDFPPTFLEFEQQMAAAFRQSPDATASDPPASSTLDRALRRYGQLEALDPPRADAHLLDWLRAAPERGTALVDLLDGCARGRRCGLSGEHQLSMWRLLVELGSPQAQRAVIDAATDGRRSTRTRTRALAHLQQLSDPQPFVIEALAGLQERQGEIGKMALLALGSMAAPSHSSAAGAMTRLTHLLATAATREQQQAVLAAMGNAGNPGLLPSIRPMLSSRAPDLRAQAFRALRRMEDAAAFQLLIEAYRAEPVPEVKVAALTALSEMAADAATMSWAQRELLRAGAPELQRALVTYLGRHLASHPENATVLRSLLGRRLDREVKRTIHRYVKPTVPA